MLRKGLLVVGIATVAVAVFHQLFAPIAVFYAVKRQNIKIIKYHLDRGVDVNTVYGYKCTSLCWDYLGLESEDDLIYHGGGSREWSYSGTLLDVAVAKNNLQMVKLLLTHGANINAQIVVGLTPLNRAVNRNNLQMVKFLLAHGSDAKKDVIALHEAIYKGNKKIIELLIAHGADINAKEINGSTALGFNGSTALYTAVSFGDRLTSTNEEIVQLLLAHGADVNAKNNQGNTPLHGALLTSQKNKKNIVKLLLAHGADINIKNQLGVTPLRLIIGDFSYKDIESIPTKLPLGTVK